MAGDTAPRGDLETLARRQFGKLSEAERRLVGVAPKGDEAVCGPNSDNDDGANDPSKADNLLKAGGWGGDREIRAELIRWLCVDSEAAKKIGLGGVWVYAAKIEGTLDLSYATVRFPITLSRCRFTADADLSYITIPVLDLGGSYIGSLDLEGAEVRGAIRLADGFLACGEVDLAGARIGGDLDCKDGRFNAIAGDGAQVKKDVYLTNEFRAVGDVSLVETRIGGSLHCRGGGFSQVSLNGAVIGASFIWSHVKSPRDAVLDLTNASAGTIEDDRASWPLRGNLSLGGFVYGGFSIGVPTQARTRLCWLDRQDYFTPQPYRQLAKVLTDMGDGDGAKEVMFELEGRARVEGRRRLARLSLPWLFQSGRDVGSYAIVGYGIYPGRAFKWLGLLASLAWILHRRARRVGAMAPTDKDAYEEFRRDRCETPKGYQPFSAVIYSVENCIPLVKLGQDERWQPDPNPQPRVPTVAAGKFRRAVDSVLDFVVPDSAVTPAALRWFRWIMIGLGWLLATFFVAGLSGIIKVG